MSKRRTGAAAVAIAIGLLVPAIAHAEETIQVDGDVIRYVGDDGNNVVAPGETRDGEQGFVTDATPGTGCHRADATDRQVFCTSAGIVRAELSFGAGSDDY